MPRQGVESALRQRAFIALVIALASVTTLLPATTRAADDRSRISPLVTRPSGEIAGAFWAGITDDGSTAFVWTRDELLPDLPPSDRYRVFAVDVATGTLRLVTDDWRVKPEAVSTDGRLMLAAYHVDDASDSVVLLDTANGEVRPLLPDAGFLHGAVFSADGSTVALSFDRSPGDMQSKLEMFVIETASGTVDESLLVADGDLFHPQLSADGSVLAFSSYADNLAVGVGNNGSDAVVLDRSVGVMTFAYSTVDGDVADDQSTAQAISADGSIVMIGSAATNLAGPDRSGSNFWTYRFDRTTGATTEIVVPGFGGAYFSVVDSSWDASRLLMEGDGGVPYLYDIPSGRVVDVTRTADGAPSEGGPPGGYPQNVSMNADGTAVVIITTATNLGPDRDDVADVFVWELTGSELPETAPAAPPSTTQPAVPVEPPTTTPPTTPAPTTTTSPTPPVDESADTSDVDIQIRWACSPLALLPGAPLWCPTSTGAARLAEIVLRLSFRAIFFSQSG